MQTTRVAVTHLDNQLAKGATPEVVECCGQCIQRVSRVDHGLQANPVDTQALARASETDTDLTHSPIALERHKEPRKAYE